ncbi:MAG: hypothetical protein CMP29_10500 [Roseibacillus sp.]|nr:hypothetical protein [Roseibacillus sp.]
MSAPENVSDDSVPPRLGDYLLGQLIAEDKDTWTYHARQRSMDRGVVLVRQKAAGCDQPVASFLGDVRAKAAIEHAGIGSVFEAGEDGGELYWTRELLSGQSFGELCEGGHMYIPLELTGLLKQLGRAMAHLEERGTRSASLKASDLVLGEHGILRIQNLALAGEREADETARDLRAAASLMQGLLQPGLAGTDLFGDTRLGRLFVLMMGEGEGVRLSWTQVANTAQELEQSLASEVREALEERLKASRRYRMKKIGLTVTGAAVLTVVVSALLVVDRRDAPPARDLSGMVPIPGGDYRDHEGKSALLSSFMIDAHEVTIAEYQEFLDALAVMGPSQRKAYDHGSQPRTKVDHLPDDWLMVLSSARSGGIFDGLKYDLNHPVTGVDWWDAHAYAAWKGGRLPTLREWLAVVALDDNVTPYVEGWGPVDQSPRNPGKLEIHGLAGNVAEWTRDSERNPSFPMNAKAPVACGGSFLVPASGAFSRSWVSTRALRRKDLGFRTVKGKPPQGDRTAPGKSTKRKNQGSSNGFPLRSQDDTT